MKVLNISSSKIIKTCIIQEKKLTTSNPKMIGAIPTLPVQTPQKGKGFISTYITPLFKKVKSYISLILFASKLQSFRNIKKWFPLFLYDILINKIF